MSGDRRNIPTYSATDIQKYLQGELSAREMHDLEKAALEDPFLADALEGIGLHRALTDASSERSAIPEPGKLSGAAVFRQDLDNLQARLAGRVNKTRRPLLFSSGWKIAAALILLLGLGLTAYYTLLKADKPPAPLARTENSQAAATKPVLPASPSSSQTSTPQGEAADSSSLSLPQTIAAVTPSKKADAKRLLKPAHTHPFEAAQTNTLSDSSAIPLQPDMAKASTISKASDSITYLSLRRQAIVALQNVFTGKVVDASNNNPLSGVSLHLNNSRNNIGTTTDRNGFFSVRLPKKDSAANFTVASVGYQQTSLVLTPENKFGNIVQLRPQTASMDEVVVIGYGTKRRETLRSDTVDNGDREKAVSRDVLAQKAVPAGGWAAYNNYLAANKITTATDTTLKGNETIAFRVDGKGQLSDFHVLQSLSPAHDSVITRLVQQGPAWKLVKGKKAWTRVTMTF